MQIFELQKNQKFHCHHEARKGMPRLNSRLRVLSRDDFISQGTQWICDINAEFQLECPFLENLIIMV